MERTLVVGATGQLGTATVRELLRQGLRTRALVRRRDDLDYFIRLGAEAVLGDLTSEQDVVQACQDCTAVIATANAAIPSRTGDTFERVEGLGYRNLIQASRAAGVRRFVYTSALVTRKEPVLFRRKRETERLIQASGIPHVILRLAAFMDVSFAMMGSSIPIEGSENATVLRPFSFSQRHFEKIRDSIELRRVAMIPGSGSVPHAFICVDDAARLLVAALQGGPEGIHDASGPQALTYLDVAQIYERILGISLQVKKTPAWVFRAVALLLRPFQPAASNLMELNYVGATEASAPTPKTAEAFGIRLTTADEFLRAKLAIRDARPSSFQPVP
jgi:uncharacterized protein YbjT (DUF2867 family)